MACGSAAAAGVSKDGWLEPTDVTVGNCNVGGGILDVAKYLLMIKSFQTEVPSGVYVVTSVGAIFNLVGGAIQFKDGVAFTCSAWKADWTFGKQLGVTKMGTGAGLFLGGLASIPQRFFQVLQAAKQPIGPQAAQALPIIGNIAMGGYLLMFAFLQVMCGFFIYKEWNVRKELNTLAGGNLKGLNGPEAHALWKALKEKTVDRQSAIEAQIREKVPTVGPDGKPIEMLKSIEMPGVISQERETDGELLTLISDWKEVNAKVQDLSVLCGKEVMDALKNGKMSQTEATRFCTLLLSKLQQKRRFFVILAIASVVASIAMVGTLFLTGGIWPIVFTVVFVGLTVFFSYCNIDGLLMALADTKAKKGDKTGVIFLSACIVLLTGLGIILTLNPVSLVWIGLISGVGLALMGLQAVMWRRISRDAAEAAAKEAASKEIPPKEASLEQAI